MKLITIKKLQIDLSNVGEEIEVEGGNRGRHQVGIEF